MLLFVCVCLFIFVGFVVVWLLSVFFLCFVGVWGFFWCCFDILDGCVVLIYWMGVLFCVRTLRS